ATPTADSYESATEEADGDQAAPSTATPWARRTARKTTSAKSAALPSEQHVSLAPVTPGSWEPAAMEAGSVSPPVSEWEWSQQPSRADPDPASGSVSLLLLELGGASPGADAWADPPLSGLGGGGQFRRRLLLSTRRVVSPTFAIPFRLSYRLGGSGPISKKAGARKTLSIRLGGSAVCSDPLVCLLEGLVLAYGRGGGGAALVTSAGATSVRCYFLAALPLPFALGLALGRVGATTPSGLEAVVMEVDDGSPSPKADAKSPPANPSSPGHSADSSDTLPSGTSKDEEMENKGASCSSAKGPSKQEDLEDAIRERLDVSMAKPEVVDSTPLTSQPTAFLAANSSPEGSS
ncbi:unnamed protein product, partial [Symbiodinium necroappetens]